MMRFGFEKSVLQPIEERSLVRRPRGRARLIRAAVGEKIFHLTSEVEARGPEAHPQRPDPSS